MWRRCTLCGGPPIGPIAHIARMVAQRNRCERSCHQSGRWASQEVVIMSFLMLYVSSVGETCRGGVSYSSTHPPCPLPIFKVPIYDRVASRYTLVWVVVILSEFVPSPSFSFSFNKSNVCNSGSLHTERSSQGVSSCFCWFCFVLASLWATARAFTSNWLAFREVCRRTLHGNGRILVFIAVKTSFV